MEEVCEICEGAVDMHYYCSRCGELNCGDCGEWMDDGEFWCEDCIRSAEQDRAAGGSDE